MPGSCCWSRPRFSRSPRSRSSGGRASGENTALRHHVRHPTSALQLLVDHPIKRKLWGGPPGACLVLALISPISSVAISTLLERLRSSKPTLWSDSFHYSLVIAPVLAF